MLLAFFAKKILSLLELGANLHYFYALVLLGVAPKLRLS